MKQSTSDRWSRVVQEFEASGLAAAAFCAQRGIRVGSFYSNRRKLRAAAGGAASASPRRVRAFVEAVVAGERELIVECRGGRRVVVPRGFDELTLVRMVAALEHESLRDAAGAGASA